MTLREAENFVEATCAKYNECDPEGFAEEFGDVQGCKDYYSPYYFSASSLARFASQADDPEACLAAFGGFFRCYRSYLADLSCEVFGYAWASDYYVDTLACEAEFNAFDRDCPDPDRE